MRSTKSSLCALSLLAGCTLATDAGDRTFVEHLDLDFSLTAMSPHRGDQLDVALVVPSTPGQAFAPANATNSNTIKYQLRGRARVLVPTNPSDTLFPTIEVPMLRAIDNEELQLLFYVDTTLDYTANPLKNGARDEHSWARNVPQTGELTFYHEAKFENFFDEEIGKLGGDIVLQLPDGLTAARTACLNQKLDEVVKSTLEVRFVFNVGVSPTVTGYFRMHNDNVLPTQPVRLEGVADNGATYDVQVVVDGVLSETFSSRSPAATAEGLSVPFTKWVPLDEATIASCLAQ